MGVFGVVFGGGIFHSVENFFPWRGKLFCRSARKASLARSAIAVRYRPRVRHASNTLDFGSALGYSIAWKNGFPGGDHGWPGSMVQRMSVMVLGPKRSCSRVRISWAGAPRSSMSQAGWDTKTVRSWLS